MKRDNPHVVDALKDPKFVENESFPRFGDKKAVGDMAGGFSTRWVDDQLRQGMPHLKLGSRRVRFDMEEVRIWLKERYGQQRRGSLVGMQNGNLSELERSDRK